MAETSFYKDPPRMILDLMKATFGDRIKAYFLGAPSYVFPEAAYPVCVVQSVQSKNTITGAPTGTDSVGELIHIYFMENGADDQGGTDDEDTTMRKLYNKIQGRDPATGYYLAGTALYALRTNISLMNGNVNTTIDQDVSVDYDVIPRADSPVIMEAIISIVTRERVQVPNRV